MLKLLIIFSFYNIVATLVFAVVSFTVSLAGTEMPIGTYLITSIISAYFYGIYYIKHRRRMPNSSQCWVLALISSIPAIIIAFTFFLIFYNSEVLFVKDTITSKGTLTLVLLFCVFVMIVAAMHASIFRSIFLLSATNYLKKIKKTKSVKKNQTPPLSLQILLVVIIFSCPFFYLASLFVVLNNPNILYQLGLGPFIDFLVNDLVPSGYENLIELKDNQFAVYFSHFHATTLLISYIFFIPMMVCSYFTTRNSKFPNKMGRPMTHLLIGLGFVFCAVSYQIWLPFFANDSGRRYNVTRGSISGFVLASIFTIIALQFFGAGLFMVITTHYIPKFQKWLSS